MMMVRTDIQKESRRCEVRSKEQQIGENESLARGIFLSGVRLLSYSSQEVLEMKQYDVWYTLKDGSSLRTRAPGKDKDAAWQHIRNCGTGTIPK